MPSAPTSRCCDSLQSSWAGAVGRRLVGWNPCWIFLGVIRKCRKKTAGSNSRFVLEQQLNLRGVSLWSVFFFVFGIKNQVSSNHERHFGRFHNDNSGSSYCFYMIFGLNRTVFDLSFSYCPMIQPSNAILFLIVGTYCEKKISHSVILERQQKTFRRIRKNSSYFIKLDKAALFKEDYCWGSKFPGAMLDLGGTSKKTIVSWY